MAAGELPVQELEAEAHAAQSFRGERLSRIKKAVISSILIRPLALIIPLVTVALFPKYLGEERYGLYQLVGALVMWLGMTNLGLTMGLINKLIDCNVKDDRVLARRYVSSLVLALTAMAVVSIVIFTVVVPVIHWTHFIKLTDSRAIRETPWAIWVAGIFTLLSLLTSLPNAVYFGYQELHRANIWDGAAKVATLLACIAVVFTRTGVIGVIIATAGVGAFVRIANMVYLFGREKTWLMPSRSLFDFALLKTTVSEGILLFVLQLSAMMLVQMDKVVIGLGVNTSAVSGYSIASQFFVSVSGLFYIVLSPLWAASGEAVRRGDIAWIKKSLRYSLALGCSLPLICGGVLLVFGNWIIVHWTRGQNVEISKSIILALTAMFALRAWVDCQSIILNSASVLIPQIIFYAGHAVLNLIVAIIAVRFWGVAGVAWSTPITSLFTSVWGYPYLMRKYILHRK